MQTERPLTFEQGTACVKRCCRGPKPPLDRKHEYLFTLHTPERASSGCSGFPRDAFFKKQSCGDIISADTDDGHLELTAQEETK